MIVATEPYNIQFDYKYHKCYQKSNNNIFLSKRGYIQIDEHIQMMKQVK